MAFTNGNSPSLRLSRSPRRAEKKGNACCDDTTPGTLIGRAFFPLSEAAYERASCGEGGGMKEFRRGRSFPPILVPGTAWDLHEGCEALS